ncbi:MAG: TetR/AcrR family transcriptional regulator [Betaproteobacteria bacterium]|nr:TetR/AcrR family transcriptional regulator [Betaproteobacteria bacterium]
MNAAEKLRKGEQTRAAILDKAVEITSQLGLEGLTIGTLAEATKMSKSGLFAHFGSRDELLLATLDYGTALFTEQVFLPALKAPRGLPRVRALFGNWLAWTESTRLPGGCPMIGAAAEYDDRPGPVRDRLQQGQWQWIDTLKKSVQMAKDEGHLAPEADIEQIVFEMFGIGLVMHHHRRLLGDAKARARALAAFESLLERHSVSPAQPTLRAASR